MLGLCWLVLRWLSVAETSAVQAAQSSGAEAVKIKREAFDTILAAAVCSGYESDLHPTEKDWKHAVNRSDVRLQWDPDHSPTGGKLTRKAIQLGLRGDTLGAYAREWIISIEDISEFVRQQYQHINDFDRLIVPSETIYPVTDSDTISRLQLSIESRDFNLTPQI